MDDSSSKNMSLYFEFDDIHQRRENVYVCSSMTLRPHEINDKHQFIAGWYNDSPVLDKLIAYHKISPNQVPGRVGGEYVVNKEAKDSIDVPLVDEPLKGEYNFYLQDAVDEYIKKYSYCNDNGPWSNGSDYSNIQHYKPGGGYFAWHCERADASPTMCHRHLVYMTYLNDVTDAGETEWYYQKLKIQPRKGLTVIWPSDWTFTHRGLASPTQDKYIITGWFYYV